MIVRIEQTPTDRWHWLLVTNEGTVLKTSVFEYCTEHEARACAEKADKLMTEIARHLL